MTNLEYLKTLNVFDFTDCIADIAFPPDPSGIIDLRKESPIMKFYDRMIKYLNSEYKGS